MRRVTLLALAVVLAFGLSGTAAGYKTYESITVANASIGFTDATINPPGYMQQNHCEGRLETAEIRYRWDGAAPTTTEGIVLQPLEMLTISTNEDAAKLRMIRTGSTSGVIKFTCWAQ